MCEEKAEDPGVAKQYVAGSNKNPREDAKHFHYQGYLAQYEVEDSNYLVNLINALRKEQEELDLKLDAASDVIFKRLGGNRDRIGLNRMGRY